MMAVDKFECRACGEKALEFVRASTITGDLGSSNFAITDSAYGVTAAIYRCSTCGLLQCADSTDVLAFYEALQDPQYEDGREERSLQAGKLIEELLNVLGRGDGVGLKLLDVGAGSGVLLEAAERRGFEAVGIEPSSWLVSVARGRGLSVYEGVLPHSALSAAFDVVMLIDVIEHVADPLSLLDEIRDHLKPGGIAIMVTPDVSSFFARLMGFNWWHYRIAHISYFNKETLRIVAERAGLRPRSFSRPGWYFSYAYLRERLLRYLPSWVLPPAVGFLRHVVIPLNLRDSLLMVCDRA